MQTHTGSFLFIGVGLFFLALPAGTVVAQQLPVGGLIAHFPFSGNTSNAVAGAANGIVLGQAQLTVDRFQQAISAYSFNGGGDSVSVNGLSVNTQPGQTNTVSLWFNWTGQFYSANDTSAFLFDWGASSNPFGLLIQKNTNAAPARFGITDGLGGVWGMDYTANSFSNVWLHVVGVFVNGTLANSLLYLNGQRQNCNLTLAGLPSSQNPSRSAGANAIISGYLTPQNRNRFFGVIDDVRIYNRALSAAEVTALSTIERGPYIFIGKAVRLAMTGIVFGANYQLQFSNDLTNWSNRGSPFTAAAPIVTNYVDVGDFNTFWRLLQVP